MAGQRRKADRDRSTGSVHELRIWQWRRWRCDNQPVCGKAAVLPDLWLAAGRGSALLWLVRPAVRGGPRDSRAGRQAKVWREADRTVAPRTAPPRRHPGRVVGRRVRDNDGVARWVG